VKQDGALHRPRRAELCNIKRGPLSATRNGRGAPAVHRGPRGGSSP
jgi:hypothetical protein